MSEAEVGQGGAEAWQSGAALDALRAGDLDGFTDALHAARFSTTMAALAALRSVAGAIVDEGLAAGFAPTATVDEITATLAGRCGIAVDPNDIGANISEDDADAPGQRSRRSLVATGALDDTALRRELLNAYDEIARLRAERDTLEARVDELAGARVLADQLAAELERDEWIRARLRRLKATRPVKGLIYSRRWLRSRTSSDTSR